MELDLSRAAELEATARAYVAQLCGTEQGGCDGAEVATMLAILDATLRAAKLALVQRRDAAMADWGTTVQCALDRRSVLRKDGEAPGLRELARWWATTAREDVGHWQTTAVWGEFSRAFAVVLLAMPRTVAELERRLEPVYLWKATDAAPGEWTYERYACVTEALRAVWRRSGTSE